MLAIRLVLLFAGLLLWWPLLIVWLVLTIQPHLKSSAKTMHVYHHAVLPWALHAEQPPVVESPSWLDDLS